MLSNAIHCTETFYKLGQDIAPNIQNYVGMVGSDITEYGLPGLTCLGTLVIGLLATVATDKYLMKQNPFIY